MKELIRNVLKEESLRKSLIDMIKDGDFNFAVEIVGGDDEFKKILNVETAIDYLHLFDDMEVVKAKENPDFVLFRYKNQENLMVYHIPTSIVFLSEQLFINASRIYYINFNHIKQWMDEVYGLKHAVGINAMTDKYKIMEGYSKENLQEDIKQESLKQTLMDEIVRSGIRDTSNIMSVDVKELLHMVGIKGTQEDMVFLTKSIMENEVKEQLNYCSYDIVPSIHSIKLYVYTPKPLPQDRGSWYHDKRLRQEAEDLIRHWLYVLGGGLIRGHYVHVSNTGDC